MNAYLDDLLSKYVRTSGVRLAMVIDSKMRVFGASATSSDVSNETDRRLLMHLRSLSDLVITDAATAAIEQYGPSKFCDIEIWSKSGDFRGLEEIPSRDDKYGISLKRITDADSRLKLLRLSRESILLETGPNLTAQLAELRLIDFASISVTGTGSAQNAAAILDEFARSMQLGYLALEGKDWFNETLFARFER